MENQDFKISFKAVWILVIGNTLLTIIGVYTRLENWECSTLLLIAALMLTLSTWVIIVSDIIQQKIYNKTFWLMAMIIMPFIAPLFYMIQRKKLLSIAQRINS